MEEEVIEYFCESQEKYPREGGKCASFQTMRMTTERHSRFCHSAVFMGRSGDAPSDQHILLFKSYNSKLYDLLTVHLRNM